MAIIGRGKMLAGFMLACSVPDCGDQENVLWEIQGWGNMFVGAYVGHVACLSAANRKKVWEKEKAPL